MKAFPDLYNKDSLATAEELAPFKNKASSLAAIDYLVCLNSDVFIQSHGGNFGRVMQVCKISAFTSFYSCVFHSLSLCFVLFQFCDVAQVVIMYPQRGFSQVWL